MKEHNSRRLLKEVAHDCAHSTIAEALIVLLEASCPALDGNGVLQVDGSLDLGHSCRCILRAIQPRQNSRGFLWSAFLDKVARRFGGEEQADDADDNDYRLNGQRLHRVSEMARIDPSLLTMRQPIAEVSLRKA